MRVARIAFAMLSAAFIALLFYIYGQLSLCPDGPRPFAHGFGHSVDRGDEVRRSARPHGDLRHGPIDDDADRAVCSPPPCEHLFGCRDPCATLEPGRSSAGYQHLDHMRLFAFIGSSSSSSSIPLPAPAKQRASGRPRTSKIRTAGTSSGKQQSSRGTPVMIHAVHAGARRAPPSLVLSSGYHLVSELLHCLVLMLTIFFLSLGTLASCRPRACLLEIPHRHQIRTLFLVFLALSSCGRAAGFAVVQQQSTQSNEEPTTASLPLL